MKESFNNTILNLISVNTNVRSKGMSQLRETIHQTEESQFHKIAYGLFYYFWFSDGYEQQERDIEQILEFLNGFDSEKQDKFFQSLVLVFIKFSNQID